jgi:subtilisin family serine protease
MSKLRKFMAFSLISLAFGLVTLGLLASHPASAEAHATPAGRSQQKINWDDWDVIPGRVLITYGSSRSTGIKLQASSSGVGGLTLTPIEAPVMDQYAQQHRTNAGFISILPDTFVGEFDPQDRAAILQALAADPDVLTFEPDRLRVAAFTWGTSTPNDPRLPLWGMTRIGAPAAWKRQSATRASVRVAVMETTGRFDSTHRDLANQNSAVISNTLPITSHATHVAGIMAATGNNGLDVAGVANVELVALGAASSGTTFVQAVSWAVNNQVRVVNMSFKWCGSAGCGTGVCSYPVPLAAEQAAINNALGNIVFVGAAANDSCSTDSSGNAPIPASYNGVIGVSALTSTITSTAGIPTWLDALASFSNFGSYVDLTAPGVNIVSTDLANTTSIKDGTSMAAPHVAGSAAAVLAIRPNYDIRSIPLLLSLTAEDIGSAGRDNNFGDGVVRVDRATAAIADVYANSAQCGITGLLRDPLCAWSSALNSTPTGGTLGLVRGSYFAGAQTLTKPMSIVAVGGTVVIGGP